MPAVARRTAPKANGKARTKAAKAAKAARAKRAAPQPRVAKPRAAASAAGRRGRKALFGENMTRVQINLPPTVYQRMRDAARKDGISVAELIRRELGVVPG